VMEAAGILAWFVLNQANRKAAPMFNGQVGALNSGALLD
jgi:hypothetical protein